MPSNKRTRPPGDAEYRVAVENFGPIVNASIAVRPLTLFIGPSNTGKSYLAILLYALHRSFGPREPFSQGWRPRRFPGWAAGPPGLFPNTVLASLKAWLSETSGGPPSALPAGVVPWVRGALEQAAGPNGTLQEELQRCYGVDRPADLVRKQRAKDGAELRLRVPRSNGSADSEYRFKFGQRSGEGTVSGVETPSIEASVTDFLRNAREYFTGVEHAGLDEIDLELPSMVSSLLEGLFVDLFRPVHRKAFYLPADRTGVMHSHQVVVSTLVQSAATAGLRPSRDIPMLSGVLADFLSELIEMSARRRRRRKDAAMGTRLEQAMLDGSVRLERTEGGYPTFAYRPEGWKDNLPLMRASSMVSELAPVVLYLRHVVRRGDVLIIEEPEAHLHPAMQTVFALELARLVRDGVRIVMTTHSEWFLEQIGNLVRLSELPEEKRRGLDGADCALRPEQVGAWLFKRSSRPAGSVVEEVTLDAETGLYPTDYDTVSEMLYNQSARTFNRAQAGSET